jgi:LDH2 family malate/lactate/ureidoglycolate dehydrogenase
MRSVSAIAANGHSWPPCTLDDNVSSHHSHDDREDFLLIEAATLEQQGVEVLVSAGGYSSEAAQLTIRHLVEAERAGKSCHGLVRLPDLIANKFGFCRFDRPQPLRPADSLLVFEGSGRPGLYVLAVMVETAIDVARRTGVCLALGRSVYPSGHLGGYGRRAAEAGLVAHIESTSPSRVTAPGHGRPYVGTNPICRAFPTRDGLPVIIDLATSAITHGDLMLIEANGGALPAGVAVCGDGTAATSVHDIDLLRQFGGILPFGQRDAYKAFALALGVALQTSYSGAPPASSGGTSFAASVFLFDPSRLDASGDERRARWLTTLSEAEGVRIPGWMSVAAARSFEASGVVPVKRRTWEAIRRHLPGLDHIPREAAPDAGIAKKIHSNHKIELRQTPQPTPSM